MLRLIPAVLLVMLAFAAAASTPVVAADRDRLVFTATLSSRNEVPPNQTRSFGFTLFTRQFGTNNLRYHLITVLTDNVTQAHIHCAADGVNGPVVAFLFGPSAPTTVNGVLAQGTIDAGDVIAVPSSPSCPGGISNLHDLLKKMEMGMTYVNVHTTAIPAGQIRGQIK